jgi:hypothetical protein
MRSPLDITVRQRRKLLLRYEPEVMRLLRVLSGYDCAGLEGVLCGECGACEANAMLLRLGEGERIDGVPGTGASGGMDAD